MPSDWKRRLAKTRREDTERRVAQAMKEQRLILHIRALLDKELVGQSSRKVPVLDAVRALVKV